jgi:tRNA threonylcarbamoyladenosine biosynthesis protein TsaB
MDNDGQTVSVAIETSCRQGNVALGVGGQFCAAGDLGTTRKHAAALLPSLQTLLDENGLAPADVDALYVSVGPGSFTGLRVGVTVARTWGQMQPDLNIVAVPTPLAVAANAGDDWQRLGVLLAAKRSGEAAGTVYGALVRRADAAIAFDGEPLVATPQDLLATWPRPLTLTGEGLSFCQVEPAEGITLIDDSRRLPTAWAVWQIGEQLLAAGASTPWSELQVVYARRPEAVRLWEKHHGTGDEKA